MPIKLYELTEDIRKLDQIDDPDELQGTLESLAYQFKEKAINVAKFIKELDAEVVAIETEANRLLDKRTHIQNKRKYLAQYLFDNMIQVGVEKIDGTVVTLAIRKNPPSCEVPDIMQLPVEYRKLIPESWQANKNAILSHFKDTGEMISGANIITDNKRLEIK